MKRTGQDEQGNPADPLLGARSQGNPGARLLETARRLFYEQGYTQAGINEIIEQSHTSKKSFYAYYPSKQLLGLAALGVEEQDLHRFLDGLKRRHPRDYGRFVRTWAQALKRVARCGDYHGCPFANAAAQAPAEFRAPLAAIVSRVQETLSSYLTTCDLALPQRTARELSAQILMQYQGAIQMWKLTGDLSHFDRFSRTCAATGPQWAREGAGNHA